MKVVITCGGTGGHIYPALSLADALKDLENAEILFIGTSDHMEARIIPSYGYRFASVKAKGLNGSVFNKITALLLMLSETISARKILKQFQPDITVGFGGYVSAPVIQASASLHIPVVLHEQNAFAGKANLYLEKYADAVVAVYENVKNQFKKKVYLLGNPRTYTALRNKKTGLKKEYGLSAEKKMVLFVMGSQGSESINQIMKGVLKELSERDYEILYVTGESHKDDFKNETYGSNIHFASYIDQAGLLPEVDLIVTRGGATTASEIAVFKVPSIIIPSPYVPNNHQEVNAQALVDAEAAVLIREKELDNERLVKEIDFLINNDKIRQKMAENAGRLGYPHSAEDMIALMKEIVHE